MGMLDTFSQTQGSLMLGKCIPVRSHIESAFIA
jgi:hypothetical protein